MISLIDQVTSLSYKLEFETTNNTTKFEAPVLGLKAASEIGVGQISVVSDSELIIHQIKDNYQVKHLVSTYYFCNNGRAIRMPWIPKAWPRPL